MMICITSKIYWWHPANFIKSSWHFFKISDQQSPRKIPGFLDPGFTLWS